MRGAFDKLKKLRKMFWSGRRDLNSGPPAPKAGGLLKTTHLFSVLLLKQNNLVAMAACVWLCANVPKCLQGGHKSWHIRGGAWPRFACRNKLEWLRGLATAVPPTLLAKEQWLVFLGCWVRSPPPVPSYQTETESTYSGPFSRVPLVYPSYQPGHSTFASSGLSQSGFVRFADFPDRAREVEFIHN